jgi:type IX secretion system PorP/SprF family membrane protein
MKLHLALLLVICGFGSSAAHAQQDEQLSLYMYNKLQFNPAYAGSRDAISAVAVARFQWVDFKGAPNTQWFSIHTPILQKALGIGTHIVNDRIGNRSRTSAYMDLSSSISLNKKSSRLSVGLSGGIDVVGYDFSEVLVNDPQDPYYGTNFSVTKPNVGAGIYYYSDKHYLSLSVPRMLEVTSGSLSSAVDTIVKQLNSRHFFLSGGYVFDLNSVFKLQPSVLAKYTPNAPITLDANLSLLMYDKLWTGLMYRFHESMGINIVYNIKNTFSIGYVYDFPINGLRTYQTGSHEIFLRYDITPKKSSYTSPRYF